MIKDDLLATAQLAHLDLGEDESASALPAFEQMLGYFAAMRTLGASEDTTAYRRAHATYRQFRSDAANNASNENTNPGNNPGNPANPLSGLSDALLNRAGERDGRFIVVPNVL